MLYDKIYNDYQLIYKQEQKKLSCLNKLRITFLKKPNYWNEKIIKKLIIKLKEEKIYDKEKLIQLLGWYSEQANWRYPDLLLIGMNMLFTLVLFLATPLIQVNLFSENFKEAWSYYIKISNIILYIVLSVLNALIFILYNYKIRKTTHKYIIPYLREIILKMK